MIAKQVTVAVAREWIINMQGQYRLAMLVNVGTGMVIKVGKPERLAVMAASEFIDCQVVSV